MIVTQIPRGFFNLYIHSLKPMSEFTELALYEFKHCLQASKQPCKQASKQALGVLYAIDDSGMENMQG